MILSSLRFGRFLPYENGQVTLTSLLKDLNNLLSSTNVKRLCTADLLTILLHRDIATIPHLSRTVLFPLFYAPPPPHLLFTLILYTFSLTFSSRLTPLMPVWVLTHFCLSETTPSLRIYSQDKEFLPPSLLLHNFFFSLPLDRRPSTEAPRIE